MVHPLPYHYILWLVYPLTNGYFREGESGTGEARRAPRLAARAKPRATERPATFDPPRDAAPYICGTVERNHSTAEKPSGEVSRRVDKGEDNH